MEINSLSKYISLNKLVNGTVEVLFAGQPCLTIHESGMRDEKTSAWRINPVFAKLFYGANIFEDIPSCDEQFDTTEEAVADGLVKLHDLGAFKTEYDFPEDSYAATMNVVAEDVMAYSLKNTKNITEASRKYVKLMRSVANYTFEKEIRSEYIANKLLGDEKTATTPKAKSSPMHHLKSATGQIISSHETDTGAISAFKNLSDTRGVKITKESEDGDVDITPVVEQTSVFYKWKLINKGVK